MNRISPLFWLVLGSTALLQACGAADQAEKAAEPRPAKLLKLGAQSKQASNSFPAVIRSVRSTDLAFQVGGQITTRHSSCGPHSESREMIGAVIRQCPSISDMEDQKILSQKQPICIPCRSGPNRGSRLRNEKRLWQRT